MVVQKNYYFILLSLCFLSGLILILGCQEDISRVHKEDFTKPTISILWQADLDGSGVLNNSISRVKLTPEGNYLIIFHYNGGAYGIPTRVDKLDASTGEHTWGSYRTVTKPGERISLNGWVDGEANLYIMGSWSGHTIWKYDPELKKELCSYTGGHGFEYVKDAINDELDNMYVAGMTGSASSQGSRLVKLDSSFNEIWSVVSKNTHDKDDYCLGIALDSSKNVFRVGTDSSFGASDHGRLIGHNASDGNEFLNYIVNETNSRISGITIDSDDNIYIAYCYDYSSLRQERTVVQKLGLNSNMAEVMWEYRFDAIGMYVSRDAIVQHTGNSFYMAFNLRHNETTVPGIAEFDLDGNLLWKHTIDRPGWNLSSIDAKDDYIYVGLTKSDDGSQSQVLCLTTKNIPKPEAGKIDKENITLNKTNTEYLNKGIHYIDSHEYEKAIETLQKCISIEPNNAEAHYNLGRAYGNLQKLKEAEETFNKAISINKNYAEAYSGLGMVFFFQGRSNEAISACERAVELAPESGKCFEYLANLWLNLGRNKEAVEAFNRAVEIDPNNVGAYVNLSQAYFKLTLYEEAIGACRQVIRIEPEYAAVAYFNMAAAYGGLEQYNNEIESYKKVLSLKPEDRLVQMCNYMLAQAYEKLGNIEDANAALMKSASVKQSLEAQQLVARGGQYMLEGSYDKAIELLKESIENDPNNPAAYSSLGGSYMMLGRLEEAIPPLEKAVSLKPDYAEAYSVLGQVYGKLERIEEATRVLEKAVSLKHNLVDAQYNLGYAYYKNSNKESALGQYEILKRLNISKANELFYFITSGDEPNDPTGMFEKANKLMETAKSLEEAVEMFKKLVVSEPENAAMHYALALCYAKTARFEDALEPLHKTINLEPDFANAYNDLGACYANLGQLEKAIEYYNKAVALLPNFPHYHDNIGMAYVKNGDVESAFKEYEILKDLNPSMADRLFEFINSSNSDKTRNSIEALEEIIRNNSADAVACSNLGVAYMEKGLYFKALEALKKAISVNPNYDGSYHNIGLVYHKLGQYNEAIAPLQKYLKLHPNYHSSYSVLGHSYNQLGRFNDAIDVLTKAISINPDYTEDYVNLGLAYGNLGRVNEEIDTYKKLLSIKPDHAMAHNNLGYAYEYLGRFEEAIQYYKKAIEIKPGLTLAHDNLAGLAEARYRSGISYFNNGNKDLALKEYEILKTIDENTANQLLKIINRNNNSEK